MSFALANISNRAALVDLDDSWYDLERLGGAADSMTALRDAAVLHRVNATLGDDGVDDDGAFGDALSAGDVGPPVPAPRNVFAVGLNYADHIAETSREPPETPLVFTKFPSCIVGPNADVELRCDSADWEVELVVVIGTAGRDIDVERAWDHVLGLTIGQDISDRALQFAAKPPHFDLGKSRDGYGPLGPLIVSTDRFDDPSDLAITCDVNGEPKQDSRTSNLIFDIPTLIAYLSGVVTLAPGDIIFTGTPDGVGVAHTPPVFLAPGDTIVSTIDGIGTITNHCI